MQFGNFALKQCRYGSMLFPLEGLYGTYIGKSLELYGQYSEGEVALMRALLHEGDTVIDVGANIGALTVPVSQIVGDQGRVYAVEADPEIFNVLCANLALNDIRNTKPLNAFVTDVDQGSADNAMNPAGERWPPNFLSLDSLALTACDFIKVDVDGGESAVFRSGEMQIERYRPMLYFENELREKSVELLTLLIDGLGYDVYFHPTPLFAPANFLGNPVNHWAPTEFVSMMMLGVPRERSAKINLKRVAGPNDWWDFTVPVSNYITR